MLQQIRTIIRILVGILIIKTGADLAQEDLPFLGFADQQPLLTGIFIMLLGVHIIFSSIFSK